MSWSFTTSFLFFRQVFQLWFHKVINIQTYSNSIPATTPVMTVTDVAMVIVAELLIIGP